MKNSHNPVCVALDDSDYTKVERLAFITEPYAGMFKIGLMAFAANGPGLVRTIHRMKPVFLDLKLHDIPHQVAGTVAAVSNLGAEFVTVHASGGPEMVGEAVRAADGGIKVLAVTVLTSIDDRVLEITGVRSTASDQVLKLAAVALDAGAPGLVCSPLDVASLRGEFGAPDNGGPLLVVPGIRSAGHAHGDQRRTMGPHEAVAAGADVIVVGRPITGAADPAEAARKIRDEAVA
jgi:orotidine-5'-phosphate decarboxylase